MVLWFTAHAWKRCHERINGFTEDTALEFLNRVSRSLVLRKICGKHGEREIRLVITSSQALKVVVDSLGGGLITVLIAEPVHGSRLHTALETLKRKVA